MGLSRKLSRASASSRDGVEKMEGLVPTEREQPAESTYQGLQPFAMGRPEDSKFTGSTGMSQVQKDRAALFRKSEMGLLPTGLAPADIKQQAGERQQAGEPKEEETEAGISLELKDRMLSSNSFLALPFVVPDNTRVLHNVDLSVSLLFSQYKHARGMAKLPDEYERLYLVKVRTACRFDPCLKPY
jgi:hypothetical protein